MYIFLHLTPPFHHIIFTFYPILTLPRLSQNSRAGSLLPPSFCLSPFRLPMHHRHIFLTSNSMTTFSSPVCVQVPTSLSPFPSRSWRDRSFPARQLKIYNLGSFIYTHTLRSASCIIYLAILIVDFSFSPSHIQPHHYKSHPHQLPSETYR